MRLGQSPYSQKAGNDQSEEELDLDLIEENDDDFDQGEEFDEGHMPDFTEYCEDQLELIACDRDASDGETKEAEREF